MQYAVHVCISGLREYPNALPTMTTSMAAAATMTTTDAILAAKSRYIPRDAARPALPLRGARGSRKNLSESGKIHDDGNIPRMCRAPKIFHLVRDADTRPAESLCPPNRPASITASMHRRESTVSDPVAALEAESMDRPCSDSPVYGLVAAYARSEAVGHLRPRSGSVARGGIELRFARRVETRCSSRASYLAWRRGSLVLYVDLNLTLFHRGIYYARPSTRIFRAFCKMMMRKSAKLLRNESNDPQRDRDLRARISIYRSQRTPGRVKAAYRDARNEILPRRGRVPRHGFILVKREESRAHRENRKTRGNEEGKGEQFCSRDEAKEESRTEFDRACLRATLTKDVASFASVCRGRDVTRDVTRRDRVAARNRAVARQSGGIA